MNQPSASEEQVTVRVFGRVQGVGFRWATRERARQLSLRGWVRNDPEGTVSLEAAGNSADLLSLYEFLQNGPPAAAVTRVDWEPSASVDLSLSFDIRR